jgi:hypothetical protein
MAGQAPFQSPGGTVGRSVNGGGAACLTVLCLTGAFIWWRNQELAARSDGKLEIELRPSPVGSSQRTGILELSLVFIWAISGVYFAFPNLFNTVFPSDSLGLLWLADLHFGRFNGATKAVWSVVGLVPGVLPFTSVFVCCRRMIFDKPSNPNL